jgi:4,5-dihydroxyphthalate decarboxylase
VARNIPITIACTDVDRVAAIKDGKVGVDGCDVSYFSLEPEEAFFRAFRNQEFDVTELSFSSYLLSTSKNSCPYIAVPAFLSRVFRHSGIYIRTDRGIKSPADLKGKLVGCPEYQLTALVWIRGMLKDEYNIEASDIRWRSGGQEEPGRDERTPLILTNGVELKPIPEDATLCDMLVKGELDAIFTARTPSCFSRGAASVGRLFPNYRDEEKKYFKKTGLFPIMHVIAIRKQLVEQYPWLALNVYKAFCRAKDLALEQVREVGWASATLPWCYAEALETIELMGKDYWKYGVAENKRDIEAMARYSYEQGLAVRKLTAEDLFARSTLEISKI